jgi:hypothetical protein
MKKFKVGWITVYPSVILFYAAVELFAMSLSYSLGQDAHTRKIVVAVVGFIMGIRYPVVGMDIEG